MNLAAPLAAILAGALAGVQMTGVAFGPGIQTEGLQTNPAELSRFVALSGSGQYASDLSSVTSHATTARDAWPHTLTAGDWESDNTSGNCEPVGGTGPADTVRQAATDLWAMAMAGYLTGTTSYYTAARTRVLEFAAMTDFEIANLSGSNQCILDLGSAAAHVFEAAWLMEAAGWSGWSAGDRATLVAWAAGEVFPLLSWGIDNRKNNWAPVTFASALAAAAYTRGYVDTLTLWSGGTTSPNGYVVGAQARVAKWLSKQAGDELDSECQDAGHPFGLQSYGGFPDEVRRTTGGGSDPANCIQTSIAFACSGPTTCSLDAHFYQQKSLTGLVHVCEILRRLGDGGACFATTGHGGPNPAIIDAALFATGGDFQSYYVTDTTQGFRFVAGEFFDNAGLLAARDSGAVSVRGGRDYAYTRITHAPGVAYP